MDILTYSSNSEMMGYQVDTARLEIASKNTKSDMQMRVIAAVFACATFSVPDAGVALDLPSISPADTFRDFYASYGLYNSSRVLVTGFDYDGYVRSNTDVISALNSLMRKLERESEVVAIEFEQYDSPEDEDSTLLVSIRCSHEDWGYYDRLESEIISPWLEGQPLSILSRATVTIGSPIDRDAV